MSFSSPAWIGITIFVIIVGVLCGAADGTFFDTDTTSGLNKLAGTSEYNASMISTLPSTLWNMLTWDQSFFTSEDSIGRYLRPVMVSLTLYILIPIALLLFSTIKSVVSAFTGGG